MLGHDGAIDVGSTTGRLLALFDEAWRRARRRRWLLAILIVGTAVAFSTSLWRRGGDGSPPGAHVLALRLPKAPGMGVACPAAPNSFACDRIGIAVWMNDAPRRLVATVYGHSVTLHDETTTCLRLQPCAHAYRGPHFWTGYLQPAGLLSGPMKVTPDAGRYRWYGHHPVTGVLRIVATYQDGTTAVATRRVPLAPGWG
jgi:hypothetical protein